MDSNYFILLCFWTFIPTVQMYKSCEGSLYRSQHYTYTIDPDTGEQVWSHCMFPIPTHDHTLCGRPAKDGRYFLCDPDGILDRTAHGNNCFYSSSKRILILVYPTVFNPFPNDKIYTLPISKSLQTTILNLIKRGERSPKG